MNYYIIYVPEPRDLAPVTIGPFKSESARTRRINMVVKAKRLRSTEMIYLLDVDEFGHPRVWRF